MEVRFLGVRGSYPVSGPRFSKYGGNTTSILINSGDTSLIIDAGTGITGLADKNNFRENVVLLFTHYHLDHILGLPFASLLYSEGFRRKMFGPNFGNFSVKEALEVLSNPKLLPFKISDRMLETRILPVEGKFSEGNFRVFPLYSRNHPLDGVMLYRIEAEGKSLGIATDYEVGKDRSGVSEFFSGMDLLIHDAQYTQEEYTTRKGYGHSTEITAAEMAAESRVSKLVLFHFDPFHTDSCVDAQERRAREVFPETLAARENMKIEL